jgi:hypothetical protein
MVTNVVELENVFSNFIWVWYLRPMAGETHTLRYFETKYDKKRGS